MEDKCESRCWTQPAAEALEQASKENKNIIAPEVAAESQTDACLLVSKSCSSCSHGAYVTGPDAPTLRQQLQEKSAVPDPHLSIFHQQHQQTQKKENSSVRDYFHVIPGRSTGNCNSTTAPFDMSQSQVTQTPHHGGILGLMSSSSFTSSPHCARNALSVPGTTVSTLMRRWSSVANDSHKALQQQQHQQLDMDRRRSTPFSAIFFARSPKTRLKHLAQRFLPASCAGNDSNNASGDSKHDKDERSTTSSSTRERPATNDGEVCPFNGSMHDTAAPEMMPTLRDSTLVKTSASSKECRSQRDAPYGKHAVPSLPAVYVSPHRAASDSTATAALTGADANNETGIKRQQQSVQIHSSDISFDSLHNADLRAAPGTRVTLPATAQGAEHDFCYCELSGTVAVEADESRLERAEILSVEEHLPTSLCSSLRERLRACFCFSAVNPSNVDDSCINTHPYVLTGRQLGFRKKDSLLSQMPVVALGVLVALLDNMPNAMLLVPAQHQALLRMAPTAIMATTLASQIVLAVFSTFPCVVGAYTVENAPFLRSISEEVTRRLSTDKSNIPQSDTDAWIYSTTLACWSIASFLTAALFFVLGTLKLGKLIADYVPPALLLGCIGGMGIFIVTSALGICAASEWSWTTVAILQIFSREALPRVVLTLAAEVVLIVGEVRSTIPGLTPTVLLSFPALCYIFFYFAGMSVDDARKSNWLLNSSAPVSGAAAASLHMNTHGEPNVTKIVEGPPFMPEALTGLFGSATKGSSKRLIFSAGSPQTGMNSATGHFLLPVSSFSPDSLSVFTQFSFNHVHWRCVFSQGLSIVAITLLSVLHAPINVPSLSLSTALPASLDYELKVHGVANFASACTGGLQCYMAYSTTMLMWKCGLRTRAASLLIGLGTAILLQIVPPSTLLMYFPRPAAALLMMHVGVVLVNDGIIASWSLLPWPEYVVVLLIVMVMQYAFTEGIFAGLLLVMLLQAVRTYTERVREGRPWLQA